MAACIKASIETVLVGKGQVIELTLAAVLSGGHVLVEDVPGIGKTTLARRASQSLSGGAGTGYGDKQSGHREGCQKHYAALKGEGDVEFQTLPDRE